MKYRKPRLRLLLAVVAVAIGASLAVEGASAADPVYYYGFDNLNVPARFCGWQQISADPDPAAPEIALLQRFQAQGWIPTAAGAALLSTHTLPRGRVDSDGTETGAVVLAKGPHPSTGRSLQHRAVPQRKTGSAHVFFYCGVGQKANVTYTVGPNTYEFVDWYDENFNTGGTRTVVGPTTYCPGGSGNCLVYAFHKPASPWFVFDATVHSTGGGPWIQSSYCGG